MQEPTAISFPGIWPSRLKLCASSLETRGKLLPTIHRRSTSSAAPTPAAAGGRLSRGKKTGSSPCSSLARKGGALLFCLGEGGVERCVCVGGGGLARLGFGCKCSCRF